MSDLLRLLIIISSITLSLIQEESFNTMSKLKALPAGEMVVGLFYPISRQMIKNQLSWATPLVFILSVSFFSVPNAIKDWLEQLTEANKHVSILLKKGEALKEAAEHEYISTIHFSAIVGRSPKTITNLAGQGKFKKSFKDAGGNWMIHISELEKFNKSER